MTKKLTVANLTTLFSAAIVRLVANGSNFYGWKNDPAFAGDGTATIDGSPASAQEIYQRMKEKLDGAYGERFLTTLGLVAALIRNGYTVRFVQFVEEAGIPFDAKGWTVIIVETLPVFHINPDDLQLADCEGIVEILSDNSTPDVCWKQTNKVGEFTALLAGAREPGLDLVKIAQENSK